MTVTTETFALPAQPVSRPPPALVVMGRVIHALILREARTRYGRTMFGYVWAFLTPLAWVGLYAFFRLSVDEQPPFGQSIYVWAAGGILIYKLYSNIAGRITSAVTSNRSLLSYPVVRITDMMVARAVLETATMLVILIFVWALLKQVEDIRIIHHPDRIMMAIITTISLGYAMGSFNGVLAGLFPTWGNIWGMTSMPMLVTSGALFVPSQMPPVVLDILRWHPVLNCIEWMRDGIYLDYTPVLDRQYIWTFILILTFIAFLMERLFRRQLLEN